MKQEGGFKFHKQIKYLKDNNPLISIITVVFNSEKYIEKTINSVLEQTYDNYEYIIIDGGSTDKTVEIIKKYEDKIFYWVSEPDDGIYDAMNKGIKLANGTIIGLLNSGDFYTPKALEIVARNYNIHSKEANHNLVITGTMSRFSENKKLKFKQIANKFDLCGPILINHPASFVSRSVYENIGYFDLQYRICADYDFILRAYHNKKIEFIYISDNLTYMMMGGISENQLTLIKRFKERFQIRSKYVPFIYNILESLTWLFKKVIYYFLLLLIGDKIFWIKLITTHLKQKK